MGIKNREKFKKGSMDYFLLGISIILFAIGSIVLLSASSPKGLTEYGNSHYYFIKQWEFAIIGFLIGILVYSIDYRNWEKKAFLTILYPILIVLTIIVQFIGTEVKGAVRWINIGGFTLQPSEFVKIGIIVFSAGFLSSMIKTKRIKSKKWNSFSMILLVLIAGLTFVIQNHLSAALLMVIAFFVQLVVAGVNFKLLLSIVGVVVIAGSMLVIPMFSNTSGGFRGSRIRVWLNPFEYIKSEGWQIIQSLYAIGSGGLIGAGIGDSKQKQSYIPEPQNDFIFAIFSEELGFIGVVVVLILFFILIARGLMIARNASDIFGKILASGIISLLGAQIILNLAVVSNTIPVTGISLPFFSYGGSAMVAICIQIALLLNISKVTSKQKEE